MSNSDYWAGKRVIVTAGAAGIGLAIARAFHDRGAKVWVCDVADESLASAAAATPGLGTMRCDVADAGQVDAFVAAAVGAMGGLDIVINNAGIAGPAAPAEAIHCRSPQVGAAVRAGGNRWSAAAAGVRLGRRDTGAGGWAGVASATARTVSPTPRLRRGVTRPA
jgi:NAD(P)-dependent dehydrogenase (short-subunit alcohol dehydrogenase family)